MNKILTTSITSLIAIIVLIMAIANPFVAIAEIPLTVPPDYDPENEDYSYDECAEMFDPVYDNARFQMCTGQIGGPAGPP